MLEWVMHKSAKLPGIQEKFVAMCLFLVIFGLVPLSALIAKYSFPRNTATFSPVPPLVAKPIYPQSLQLNTLFLGDVFVGRRINTWAQASGLGYAYPFSGLHTLGRENYDAWIANLECPVTTSTVTKAQEEVQLKFNCDPRYIPEAAKWFDVFGLANNHMDNMQEVDGLNQTRKFLDESGIQYFGHFDNAVQADICEIVSFKVRPQYAEEPEEVKEFSLPIALCGYHNLFKIPTDAELAVMQEYSKYFITIAMPHQGVEYTLYPDGLKKTVFRKMIDNGADVVLGGHPHVVQDAEVYKEKLIVYSLGNFIFDQQWNADVTTGIGVNLDFNFPFSLNLKQWSDLASSCTVFKDNCLSEVQRLGLAKPEFTMQANIVATSDADKLAKKGSDADQAKMLARLNWGNIQDSL